MGDVAPPLPPRATTPAGPTLTPPLAPRAIPPPPRPAARAPSGPFPITAFPSWVPWRPPRRPVEATQPLWLRVLVPFIIFVCAFGVYQFFPETVDHPNIIVFDEAHYVKVARNFSNGVFIDPAWGAKDPRPQNFEHPPLGKYLIAAGIWLNGKPHNEMENQRYITTLCGHDNPECAPDAKGWRFSSTVVGASGIVAAYFLGMRLFNRTSAGLFAAGFLLFDGLYFMHARLAMLDIFPTAFTLWAFAFLLSPRPSGRWLSAVFYGCAIGSKYYTLYLWPVFLLLHIMRTRPPRWTEPPIAGAGQPLSATLKGRLWESFGPAAPWIRRLLPAIGIGVGLPLLTFTLLYTPYFYLWTTGHGPVFAIKEWGFVLVSAFTWDFAGQATHPYSSTPGTWLLMAKPVYYYTFDYADGDVGKMWSLGNPFLWWTSVLGMVVVGLRVLGRFFRDYGWHYLRWDFLERIVYYPFWMRRDLAFLIGALLFAFAYVPFFAIQRILFMFYMTFVTPYFSVFAGGLISEQWERGGFNRILALLYAVLVASVFLVFLPVVTGQKISKAHYEWVMGLLPWLKVAI